MSFSLKEVATEFPFTVDFKVPRPDGSHVRQSFGAVFAILPEEEMDKIASGQGSHSEDSEICRKILVGWKDKDILSEEGEPTPFSEEKRDVLIRAPYVRRGIIQSYFRAMRGEAREKN